MKHTEEQKKKWSDIRKGKNMGIENPFYGHKHSEELKQHWSKIRKGVKPSEESRKKMSVSQSGINNPCYGRIDEKHPNWKGDDVKNDALHAYVKRRLPKPDLCQICNDKEPYDLANKTGVYKRDLSNWFYLCRKCHIAYDKKEKG